MADDRNLRGPQDSSRVNLEQDYERRYWCERFGCTEDQLRRAVAKVGSSADAVGRELGNATSQSA